MPTYDPSDPRCACHGEATATIAPDQMFAALVQQLVHGHRDELAQLARREGLTAENAFDAVQEAFVTFLDLPALRLQKQLMGQIAAFEAGRRLRTGYRPAA